MTFTYRYRKQIIIAIIFIILISGGGLLVYQSYQSRPKRKTKVDKKEVLLASNQEKKVTKQKTTIEKEELYQVDIKGEVINPGIYSLKAGSRVSDVINIAGGLTEISDTTVINLSKKIKDEMVIIIYTKQEVANFKETKKIEQQAIEKCQSNYEELINDACIENKESTNSETNLISINTATLEQLQSLPGIGESKAKAILAYKEEHKEFKNIDELKNISGIGEAIFAKIKDLITL